MNVHELTVEVSEEIKALLPEQKLTAIAMSFLQLDSNQDGKIDFDEYLNFALMAEKGRLTGKFAALDGDRDGFITLEEFVVATEPMVQILKKFRELDLDKNGLLSIEEALNIADQLVLPLNETQIQSIMAEVDQDGDGQITYYEYLGAIAHIGFQ